MWCLLYSGQSIWWLALVAGNPAWPLTFTSDFWMIRMKLFRHLTWHPFGSIIRVHACFLRSLWSCQPPLFDSVCSVVLDISSDVAMVVIWHPSAPEAWHGQTEGRGNCEKGRFMLTDQSSISSGDGRLQCEDGLLWPGDCHCHFQDSHIGFKCRPWKTNF